MLDVKENFRNRYEGAGTTCALGCDEPDYQEHLISCNKIETDYLVLENDQPNYQNLFSDEIEKQSKIAIILQERYKKRQVVPTPESNSILKCILTYPDLTCPNLTCSDFLS